MGLCHSTPVPTNDDFLFVHGPPSLFLFCEDKFPPKSKYETYTFVVKKNAWTTSSDNNNNNNNNNKQTVVVNLRQRQQQEESTTTRERTIVGNDDEGIVKIVPQDNDICAFVVPTTSNAQGDDDDNDMGAANAVEGGQAIAVLRMRNDGNEVQICSLTPCRHNQRSCGEYYQGQPLYKCGTVERRKDSYQFNMKTSFDSVLYTSEYVGSVLSCCQRKQCLAVKRRGLFCATLSEPKWTCRVGPGIDPILLLCFVVGRDKIREYEKKRLEAAHYSTSYRTSTVL